METTIDLWKQYTALPDPRDLFEISQAIHIIQSKIAVRVARRANPEIWK